MWSWTINRSTVSLGERSVAVRSSRIRSSVVDLLSVCYGSYWLALTLNQKRDQVGAAADPCCRCAVSTGWEDVPCPQGEKATPQKWPLQSARTGRFSEMTEMKRDLFFSWLYSLDIKDWMMSLRELVLLVCVLVAELCAWDLETARQRTGREMPNSRQHTSCRRPALVPCTGSVSNDGVTQHKAPPPKDSTSLAVPHCEQDLVPNLQGTDDVQTVAEENCLTGEGSFEAYQMLISGHR